MLFFYPSLTHTSSLALIFSQSQTFDGKEPIWYHSDCFFRKADRAQLKVYLIENFENITYSDQLDIISKIDPKEASKFEESARKWEVEKDFSFKNFEVDYANTETEVCHTCQTDIEHKDARVKSIFYCKEKAGKFGKEILWAHLACFAFDRERYSFPWAGRLMDGFENLRPEHQQFVDENMPWVIAISLMGKFIGKLTLMIRKYSSTYFHLQTGILFENQWN